MEIIHHKKITGDFAEEATVELEFTGAVINIIETFAQENKAEPFKQVVYQCTEGKSYFKISRSTSDIRTLKTFNKDSGIFTNTGGLDGTIKSSLKLILSGLILILMMKLLSEHQPYAEHY